MDEFWLLTRRCIKSCLKKSKINASKIIAIGITGNMVGAWPIDSFNNPVRNAILWNDARSESIFNSLKKTNKKIFEDIFNISELYCSIWVYITNNQMVGKMRKKI